MGRLSQLGKMALHWGDSQMFQKVWRPVLGRVFGLLDGPVHRNNSSSPGQAVVVKGGLTHTNTMDPNKHTWSIWYFLVLDGQCTVFFHHPSSNHLSPSLVLGFWMGLG